MGGSVPGSSTRCLQCRQRRKKVFARETHDKFLNDLDQCGSERPACLRCVKSGLVCSGPGEANVFIHRDASNIARQSDRAALRAAYTARISPGSSESRAEERPAQLETYGSATAATLNPINLASVDSLFGTVSTHSLYAAIADEFKPRPTIGIFSGDRLLHGKPLYSGLAICIRALIPLISLQPRMLDLGIFGVLAKYIGIFRGDDHLVTLARSSYTLALGQFHRQLSQILSRTRSWQRDDNSFQIVLCLCLALQLFEVVDQDGLGTGLDAHIDGALVVLQITGPDTWNPQLLRQLFSGLRGMVIRVALRRRQTSFLVEEQWLTAPFGHAQKTKTEQLHDLALMLPTLLERTDALSVHRDTAVDENNSLEVLVEDYLELKDQFDEWFRAYSEEHPEHLYWLCDLIDPEHRLVSDVDSVCIPLFPDDFQLRFRNGPTAGILSHYWSFQLQLRIGLLDALPSGQMPSVPGSKKSTRSLTLRLEVQSLLNEAHSLARLVLEAVPYLSSCLEGRIAAQGPFEIVARYLGRLQMAEGEYDLSQYIALWQSLTQSQEEVN